MKPVTTYVKKKMRELRASGYSPDVIARRYGYCVETVREHTRDLAPKPGMYTHEGRTLSTSDWVKEPDVIERGIKYDALWSRLSSGWSFANAITTPGPKEGIARTPTQYGWMATGIPQRRWPKRAARHVEEAQSSGCASVTQ